MGSNQNISASDFIKLIVSALFIGSVLLLTIGSYWLNPDHIDSGPRNIPPLNSTMQNMLSEAEHEFKEFEHKEDVGFGWGDNDEDGNNTDTVENYIFNNFDSKPNNRAIVNNKYRYSIRVPNAENKVCEIDSAPEDATISDCNLEWIPESSYENATFSINIFDEESGNGVNQEFEVVVTESTFYLGTDNQGRNLSELLFLSMKWVFIPGIIVASVSLFIGLPIGAYSSYYENRYSEYLKQTEKLLESMPFIIILFIAAVTLNFNVYYIMIAVGLFMAPTISKTIYTKVTELKKLQFVDASKELGVSDSRILWSEIIWHNARVPVIAQICNLFAIALVLEVTLSYLNLGVRPPEMSLGVLLSQGKSQLLVDNLWLTVFPSIIIILVVSGYYLLAKSIEIVYTKRLLS